MKLKKLFFSLFGLLAFTPFVLADYISGMNGLYEFNINSPTELGNYTYQFDYKGNLATIDSSSQGNFVFNVFNNNPYTLWNSYAWYNGKLYYYSKSSYNGNTTQGFLDKWCIKENLSDCYNGNYVWDTEDVISIIGSISKVVYGSLTVMGWGNLGGSNQPTMLCFYDGTYYCVSCSQSTSECKSGLTGSSLNLNAENIVSLNNFSWSDSPFTPSTPTPNVDVGICPTVKTLLSTSNLTPAVCYAGYDSDLIYEAGENTPIQFGSGITIFETYDLFSGDMTIQNWYDTYWNYYQSINWNAYPFYGKPKALLGLQTARQIAGTSAGYKGSYVILNYCWYLLGNFDENASTCVLPKLDSVYSGITITNQDKQDLIDDLNDDYDIRRPGSGSIYNGVWSGNGGGSHSRGDECNSIPCMFNKFFDMFNSAVVDDVDFTSSGSGILPSYIGLAFVVVVLFYIFKR